MTISARSVALITGASAGIGAALVREAASDGHDLVLVARRREPMEALELKAMGAQITIITANLSTPGAAAALMKTVERSGLAIDTRINNAGLGDTGRFDQENSERILSMLQVNIIALTELTRLVSDRYWSHQQDHSVFHAFNADGDLVDDCRSSQSPQKRRRQQLSRCNWDLGSAENRATKLAGCGERLKISTHRYAAGAST